jgi:4-hydroxybenzoate polyprenyltransferase
MTGFFYMQQLPLFKKLFNALLFSNFFVSISAITLTLSTYLILLVHTLPDIPVHLIGFVFCSTLFIYNVYILNYSSRKKESKRETWIAKNINSITVLLLASFLGVVYNSFYLSLSQLVFLVHLAALSMLYVLPIKMNNFRFSLREFSILKIFILSYVWASVTVILPYMGIENATAESVPIVFLERFIFILALAIPFDIRDFWIDKKNNIKTLPVLMGISGAKKLSAVLLISYILVSFVIHQETYISISRLISGLLAIYLISKIKDGMDEIFYMFYIDGIMVVHFLILLIAYLFF